MSQSMGSASQQSAFDAQVRLRIYLHFVEATRAPSPDEIAAALTADSADVRAAIRRLADGRALALRKDSDDILMAHPFSAVPTRFQVHARNRTYWPNCAWDALGITALLGEQALIEGTCADCEAPITIEARDGGLRSEPLRLHFAIAPKRWWDDIELT